MQHKRINRRGATAPMMLVGLGMLMTLLVVGAIWYFGPKLGMKGSTFDTGAGVTPPPNLQTQCAQNPAYTYSAVDAFNAGTTVSGTDKIKNGADAPVSSLAAPKAGAGLLYWKDNSTYFCETKSDNAACGSNTLQTKCYQNGTATVSVRDMDNDLTLTNGGGANNLTVSANQIKNLELRIQSEGKKAIAPFGGCVAVEFPANLSEVPVTGLGDAGKCPFQYTYAVTSTSNTYRLYALPDGFDKDGTGNRKAYGIQVKSGSADPVGTVKITVQPANYYVANDGNIYLDIEKAKNSDSTKTFTGGVTTSFAIN